MESTARPRERPVGIPERGREREPRPANGVPAQMIQPCVGPDSLRVPPPPPPPAGMISRPAMNTISFDKAVEIALEQHRAGQFARAEALYVEILRQDPGNVDAMHLLGVLAHQGKQPAAAAQLIAAAISRRPDVAVFHYNLAEALSALGRTDKAIDAYGRAVALDPDYFEAHSNLGNALNAARRYAEAEAACRRAVALRPDAAPPLNNLANALRGLGRRDEAVDLYRQAIDRRPDFAEAVNNLAMCLCSMNRLAEGVDAFRAAIRLAPAEADTHNNLGTTLVQLGRHEQAGECFQTAIDLAPAHAEAHNNLGAVLRTLGRPAEAIDWFAKAAELRPDFVQAHSNHAAALSDVGRKPDALAAVDRALALRPRLVRERFMRGMILRDLGRYDDGVDDFRAALALDPDAVGPLTALGYALLERGELDEALAALRRSVELNPDPQTHSNVLLTASYHPGYSPADVLAVHRSWADLHEAPHRPAWRPHANDRAPDRRLRVGYVSPDFRSHSVATFLEPILRHHDHDRFEVFAYAHLAQVDHQTWRMRAQIDHWRETSGLTPDRVAEQVRADRIDVLVELAGHTANNAMPVFARRPAPVQVNLIGFPSTTGLSAMDYRITDERCDPTGVTDPFNTERLVRLPGTFWAYDPPHDPPDVGPLPADAAGGRVTFASVNNFTKVTPQVQQLWARLLLAVPNSRLVLQTAALSSDHVRRAVTDRFAAAGVGADRLDFRPSIDFPAFLRFLADEVDLTLDPFPFNGGTTTCHSLWMGCPVLTLAGDRHASRMGLSMMAAAGLADLVADSPEAFVSIGADLCRDLPRLAEIRRTLRDRLRAGPLLDHAGYTRHLEAAYRRMWQDWCAAGG